MIKKTNKIRQPADHNSTRTTRKVFYLIGEFVLLVVVMAGIAAAAKLILQSPAVRNLLFPQAVTGKWVGTNSGLECTGSNSRAALESYHTAANCGGTARYVMAPGNSNCSTDGSGTCYKMTGSPGAIKYLSKKKSGKCTDFKVALNFSSGWSSYESCAWQKGTSASTPVANNCPAKFGLNPITRCQTCLKNMDSTQCNTNGCCASSGTVSSGLPRAACNWTGVKCVPASTEPVTQPCFVDSGGQDCCGPISTCTGRNEAECKFAQTCNSDGKTDSKGKACLLNCGVQIGGNEPGGGAPGGGNEPGGGAPGGGYNICEQGFECKKVGNCDFDCPEGGCTSCQKPNEPGECCPTAPIVQPPGGQPPAANPTSPPGTACSATSEGVPCRTLKIGDICDAATQNKCVENTVNIVGGGPNCFCGLIPQAPVPPGQQASAPGTVCSPDSPNVCKSLKIGDVCDITALQPKCSDTFNNNVKLTDTSLRPICQCGTGTATQQPPTQALPTAIPTLTPTPTIDLSKANWFAQGTDNLCMSSIYRIFYSDRKCRDYSKIGFQTDNLPAPAPCNNDGIGDCWKALSFDGKKVTRRPSAFKNLGNDACNSYANETIQDPPIYKHPQFPDSPVPCTFNIQPLSQITGNIIVEGESSQFTRIAVYIKDVTDGTFYTENRDFNNTDKDPKNDIVAQQDKPYTFDKLFQNHTFEVYAKAFMGSKGNKQVLSVEITAIPNSLNDTPCANGVCEVTPGENNATVDFIIKFPPPSQSDIVKSRTNDKIESWLKDYEEGKCDAKCFSKRVHDEIQENIGLKTATCDPSLPGGCDFDPEDD